jgi:hypothetical protein
LKGVTISHDAVTDPFFVRDKTRLFRFATMWMWAVHRNDPSYEPYPEDNNPATHKMAVDCRWIIEGKKGQFDLTGPNRAGYWLRVKKPQISTYVVEAVGTGTVKIGKSNNIAARIASLQTSNANELRLIAQLKGDVEATLHSQLAAYRLSGEWFRLTPEVESAIGWLEKAAR